MRTVHGPRHRIPTRQTRDAMPITVTFVRLGVLFGALTLTGAWWAAVVSAALVTAAVGLADADQR